MFRRYKRWLIASVLLLLLVTGGSSLAVAKITPGAVVDQKNFRQPTCRLAWSPDDASSWAAQTFTAGITGKLTDVQLDLRGTIPQFTVAITPVDGSGQPQVGSPLATAAGTEATNNQYAWIDVVFSNPAKVVAGQQYTIVLSSTSENGTAGAYIVWQIDLGPGFKDNSGTACADGIYAGGRAFGQGSDPPGPTADFYFETLVIPTAAVTVAKTGPGVGNVSDSTGAINCGPSCSADFGLGTTVTLTANAGRGSTFAGWSGACGGKGTVCQIKLAADASANANFMLTKWPLVVTKQGQGMVSSRPVGVNCPATAARCTASFLATAAVKLSATPAKGWHFSKWTGVCHGTKPVCNLSLKAASHVGADFAKNKKP